MKDKKQKGQKDEKNSKRELEYLIWVIEEKIRRTTDEDVIILLTHQLKMWKSKLQREE